MSVTPQPAPGPSTSSFVQGLIAQGSGSSSASFPTASSKTPDPSAQGISKNVLAGTVNTGIGVDGQFSVTHHDGENGRPEVSTFDQTSMHSVSVDAAARAFFGMSKQQIASIQSQLVDAGYLTKIRAPGFIDPATAKAFGDLLQNASAYNSAGNPVTISDFLNQSAQAGFSTSLGKTSAGSVGGAGGATGNGTTTLKRQTITLTNPDDARYLVNKALEDHLGRKAKPDEIAEFSNALAASERNAPTSETDVSGPTGNTTSTSFAQPVSASARADAYATGSQSRANEAGAQSELGFMSVLQQLVGNTRSPV
jgi:hypothetical protein